MTTPTGGRREEALEKTAPKAKRRLWVAASTLAYIVLSFFWLLPSSKNPGTMIADLGDPLHLAYVLAWDAHQFLRSPANIFESNSFYPAPHSLSFSEHLIPEAILVAPVFWLTGNAILTYNVCVVVGLVLSALSMFYLVLDLTGRSGAAFLSGVAYSFTGFSLMETARVQVIHMQWWPLALLFLGRFVLTSRFKHALAFGLLLGVQGLSCSYYLLFTALALPFWLAASYLSLGRPPSAPALRNLIGAGLISGGLVALFILPYLSRVGIDTDPTISSGVDLRDFFTPGQANPILGDEDAPLATYAREYIGVSTLILALLGLGFGLAGRLSPRRLGFVWLAGATFLLGVSLALGDRAHVWGHDLGQGPLGILLKVVPLGTRHVPRFVALTKLGLGILVGVGAAEASKRLAPKLRPGAFLLFAALLPLEHWQKLEPVYGSWAPSGEKVPSVYRALFALGEGPVVELPLPEKKRLWALYQYFSTYHWRPTVFGRTRFYPAWLDFLTSRVMEFPNDASLDALDVMGVHTVVVHPFQWPEKERSLRLAELELSPRLRLVRAFVEASPVLSTSRESRIYTLAQSPVPAPCRLDGEVPRQGWRAMSPVGQGPQSAVDGDLDTWWTTRRAQRPGDLFRLGFDREWMVGAVSMQTGRRPNDFPRHIMIESRDVDGAWGRVALEGADLEARRTLAGLVANPRSAEHVFRFPSRLSTGIRMSLTAEGAYEAPWTIAEVRAYEACR